MTSAGTRNTPFSLSLPRFHVASTIVTRDRPHGTDDVEIRRATQTKEALPKKRKRGKVIGTAGKCISNNDGFQLIHENTFHSLHLPP